MNRRQILQLIAKWFMYGILAPLCLVLREQVFEYLKVFGVAPLFGGALVACVAMCEGSLAGCLYGLYCGFAAFGLGGGTENLYAFIYLVLGAVCGILCGSLFRRRFLTALICSIIINTAATVLVFFLIYFIAGRASPSALLYVGLPEIIYSTAVTVLVYPAAVFIHRSAKEAA